MDFLGRADCLIVVGTTLETGLARNIVTNGLKREIPVIEVSYPDS